MIVKFVRTGETKDFNESYAYRLIEQGKAVPVKPEPFMNEPEEAEPEENDKPKAGRKQKG